MVRRHSLIGVRAMGNEGALESIDEVLSAVVGTIQSFPEGPQGRAAAKGVMGAKRGVEKSLEEAFEAVADKWQKDISEAIDKESKVDPKGYDNVFRHLYRGGNPANVGSPNQRLFHFIGEATYKEIALNLEVYKDYTPSWSPVAQDNKRVGGEKEGEYYPPWEERALFAMGKQMGERKYDRDVIYGYRTGRGSNPDGPKYIIKPLGDRYFYEEKFHVDYSQSKSKLNDLIKRESDFSATKLTTMMDDSVEASIAKIFKRAETAARAAGGKASVPYGGMLGRRRTRKSKKWARGAVGSKTDEYGRLFARTFTRSVKGRL